MSHVFISYSKQDSEFVRYLRALLEAEGFDVWFDEISLLPGQSRESEIEKALRQSDIAIICLTTNSINKEGFIQKAIKYALDKSMEIPEGKIFLIPARLDDCPVPERLAHFHWVDLFKENGYENLLRSLVARSDQINITPKRKAQTREYEIVGDIKSKIMGQIESSSIYAEYKKIFAENHGILRASTAIKLGIPQHIIYSMVESGDLIREAQGIYRLKEMEPLAHPDLVQISLRVPRAVICLISALYYHDLTTQIPFKVYIALPRDVKTPKIEYPPVWTFHFSEEPYHAGIETQFVFEKKLHSEGKSRLDYSREELYQLIWDFVRQSHGNLGAH